MPKHRVLIVEDENDIAGLIKHTLERSGTPRPRSSAVAMRRCRRSSPHPPDLIILDLNLPVLSGVEVCRILRSRADARHVPIIMLTARTGENDRVVGLELGADDYVTKPFSLRELSARVKAVLRRSVKVDDRHRLPIRAPPQRRLRCGGRRVNGEAIRLTRREFELLRYLVQNKNRVVSRDRLLERVWGYDRLVETRSVDVHVGRLRGKLGDAGRQIETVVGLGYRFID